MSLEPLHLDNLEFQSDFVDKARLRIQQLSPEWTDYNVSDPGIMLIELFAWLAEQLIFRLDQVPDENLMMFLALFGVEPTPIQSASTELTFYLSIPFPIGRAERKDEPTAFVPAGTEVTTRPTERERAISFTTNDDLSLRAPLLKHLLRQDEVGKDYLTVLEEGEVFMAFKPEPRIGNHFYLGFDTEQPIQGYVLQLEFECAVTKKADINRQDPPWLWECSMGEDDKWQEVKVSQDSTGGLTYEQGHLILHLPRLMVAQTVYGREAYWLRCSYQPRDPRQGWYKQSPRLLTLQAFTLGGTVMASHAMIVRGEELTSSTGYPNQCLRLSQAPVLDFQEKFNEIIEVEEKYNGQREFVPWTKVEDFSTSTRHDRHFMLDRAKGEICFGPAIRQPNGKIKQYGRIPEPKARIRILHYRYGGGHEGNVRANKLEVLSSTFDYIDHVTNRTPATGGRAQEDFEETKMRVRRQMRIQQRAVTASDYERLGLKDLPAIRRIKCFTSSKTSHMIELLVVPNVIEALQSSDLSQLRVDWQLKQKIKNKLDPYRLLTTTFLVREPRYLGVQVVLKVVPEEWVWPSQLQEQIRQILIRFLSPLPWPSEDKPKTSFSEDETLYKEGWPFGGQLYLADLYARLQQVEGVQHVQTLKLKSRLVIPSQEQGTEADDIKLVTLSNHKPWLSVEPDMLICSLEHEIDILEL